MDRKNYKHGNYVDAEPNPHVDIKKYKTKDGKDDGKRYRVTDSEMKVLKKPKGQGLLGGQSAAKKKKTNKVDVDKLKDLKPIIIDLDLSRPENERKIKIKRIESKAKGGRAGYKGGKSVKKMGCAIKGKSPILR